MLEGARSLADGVDSSDEEIEEGTLKDEVRCTQSTKFFKIYISMFFTVGIMYTFTTSYNGINQQ